MTRHLGHVTLSGDRAGTYIIEEERPGRRLVIAPVTCSSAQPAEIGARDATHEEFAAFEAAYGPFLPPDGEG
jgi:hypothetical protein